MGYRRALRTISASGASTLIGLWIGMPTIGVSTGSAAAVQKTWVQESAPLWVTEVISNSGQGAQDAAYEWVEIQNRSRAAVPLTGWSVTDSNASDLLTASDLPVSAFLLLAASEELATQLEREAPGATIGIMEDGRIGNRLASSGDTVHLIDPAGRIVDEVAYGTAQIPRPDPGQTIAREGDDCVLNIAASPDSSAVQPLLASTASPVAGSTTTVPAEPGDEGGIPAWTLVSVAAGLPAIALGGRALWRCRMAVAVPATDDVEQQIP